MKPRAWVCLVEIDDLLGHEPLSGSTRLRLKAFFDEAKASGRYDFQAGSRLSNFVTQRGFRVTAGDLPDQELALSGPAEPEVLEAWRARFRRMRELQRFFGVDFDAFATEFLSCLANPAHRALCRVVCCVGVRDYRRSRAQV